MQPNTTKSLDFIRKYYLVYWMSVTRELDHRGYRCLPGGGGSCWKSCIVWFCKTAGNIQLLIYLAKFGENRCHCWKYLKVRINVFIPLNIEKLFKILNYSTPKSISNLNLERFSIFYQFSFRLFSYLINKIKYWMMHHVV